MASREDKISAPSTFESTMLAIILASIVAPVLTNVLGLAFEYHSGLFQNPPVVANLPPRHLLKFILSIIVITLLPFTISTLAISGWVLLRKHLSLREQFALAAFQFLLFCGIIIACCCVAQLPPWDCVLYVFSLLQGTARPLIPNRSDYAFMFTAYMLFGFVIRHFHH